MVESAQKPDPNEFICGMPRRMFFGHTRKKALIITAAKYDQLRQVEGKQKYADLVETYNDKTTIIAGIKRLGFEEDTISVLTDPNWQQLHMAMMTLAMDV